MSIHQMLWKSMKVLSTERKVVKGCESVLEVLKMEASDIGQADIVSRNGTNPSNSSEMLWTLWNNYKQLFFDIYAKERWYIYILLAVGVLGYGFTITNFSVSLDNLYQTSPDNLIWPFGLSQKRVGVAFWNMIFCGPLQAIPFFKAFLAVLALICAAIAWSLLFRRVTERKLSSSELLTFSTLFISYPLIHEIFLYAGNPVCFSYLLVAITLALAAEHILFGMKTRWLGILAVVILGSAISSYESAAEVFLVGFFMVLILHYGNNNKKQQSTRKYIRHSIKFCLILIAAFLFSSILGMLTSLALGNNVLGVAKGTHRDIYWLWPGSTGFEKIENCLITIFFDYGYNALFYSPIFTYITALFIALVIMIVWCFRKRSFIPCWLIGGLVASTFALSILQGQAARYRTCQSFAIFIAFIFMLLLETVQNGKAKCVLVCFISLIVLDQTKDLNLWFWNDYRRCQMDRTNFISLAQRIQAKYGSETSKPLIILGRTKEYANLRGVGGTGRDGLARIPVVGRAISQLPRRKTVSQNNGVSLFTHGTEGGAWEFYRHLEYYGYHFTEPTPEQVSNAKSKTMGMNLPSWPQEGCMLELDDTIIVHLGDESWEDENLSPFGADLRAKNLRNIERRKSILKNCLMNGAD